MTQTGATTDLLRQAMESHQSGRLRQAEALYRRVLEQAPEQPDALNLLGVLRHTEGDHRAAVDLIDKALAARPSVAAYWQNLGLARAALGDADGAMAAYRRCLAIDPDHVGAMNNLALALGQQGEMGEAEALLRDAVRRAPDFAEAAINLADLLQRLGKHAALLEAQSLIGETVDQHPGMAHAHRVRSEVLAATQDRDGALAAARLAVRLLPTAGEYHLHLARLLEKYRRFAGAAEAARSAIGCLDDPVEAEALLGLVLVASSDPNAALEHLDRALTLDQTNRSPSLSLAISAKISALQRLGRDGEAADLLAFDQSIRPHRLLPPPGFADLAQFNRDLEAAVRTSASLRWEPPGYVARLGSLTDNLLLEPTALIRGLESRIRMAIADYVAEWPDRPDHPFFRRAHERYRMVIWGVVLGTGGQVDSHIHDRSWISGAYYVRLPDFAAVSNPAAAGAIEFGRPTPDRGGPAQGPTRTVVPREGTIVLFPSYMFHRTIPFDNADQRVSISFNTHPF